MSAGGGDRPDSGKDQHALETRNGDVLGDDPGRAVAAAEVLGRYYRQQLDSGDGQALAELGDLLWWDEPQLARAAFERTAPTVTTKMPGLSWRRPSPPAIRTGRRGR